MRRRGVISSINRLELKAKRPLLVICCVIVLCFSAFAIKILASDPPVFSNVSFDPTLDVSRFSTYQVTADIANLPTDQSASVDVSGINGDGGNYWNYYANGTPVSDTVTKTMTYDAGSSKWRSGNIYPDSIYPEIFFAPSSVTWNNNPDNMVVRRNNYQLLHYANNFSSTGNMSFWIEVNAYRRSAVNSSDLEVYLVEKGHNIDFFQSDWRNSADVELAGTINRNAAFNHSHSVNSSHHLVALSANNDGTFGTKNLDISGDFWVIIYSQSPNDDRGFDLRYQGSGLCNNNGRWYSGSQAGWTTTARSGCPDAHIHLARRSSTGGVRDGVKLVTSATYDGETGNKTTNLYYNDLPNLPPNSTSFSSPSSGGTYSGDIAVAWDPASDPNNDTLNYDLYLMDENNVQVGNALLTDSALTTYNLQTTIEGQEIPNGNYSLKGTVCDQGAPANVPPDPPLCTDFNLPGTFTIDNTDPIRTISTISITSNNSNTSYAKAGDTVTLTFTTSASIPTPTVNFYSNGNIPINDISLTSPDNIHWTASYLVSPLGQSGEVSFEISSPNLNQTYLDTTDNSVMTVDNNNPIISTYSPADDSDKIATTANLVLTFAENVSAVVGKNIVIKKSSDDSTIETISLTGPQVVISGNGTIVTIDPSNDFVDKTSYYILIDSGSFSDVAGNLYAGINTSTVWNFTVGDITPPEISSVAISSNNSNSSLATSGEIVTLLFEVNEEIITPSVNFSSTNPLINSAVVTNTSGNIWTAVSTISASDLAGLISFTINFEDTSGNQGAEVTATSDNSSVTIYFDQTPTVTATDTLSATATAITTATATNSPASISPTAVVGASPSSSVSSTLESSSLASDSISQTAVRSTSPLSTPTSRVNLSSTATATYGPVEDLYNLKLKILEDGRPLAGAKVELYSIVREGTTDVHGVVEFANVESGLHKLKIFSGDEVYENDIKVNGEEK